MKRIFALLFFCGVLNAAEFYAAAGNTICRINDGGREEVWTNADSIAAMVSTPEYFLLSGKKGLSKIVRSPFRLAGGYTIEGADRKGRKRIVQYCHLCLSPDGKFLYGADYSGNFAEYPLVEGIITEPRLIRLDIPAGRHRRQDRSHPHFVGFDPAGEYLVAADLGGNCLLAWPFHEKTGIDRSALHVSKMSPRDAGPRQIAFSKDGKFAFSVNELSNSIGIFSYRQGVFTFLKDLPLLDEEFRNKSFAGALKLAPDGKVLIATNRGADTLSVIAVDGEKSRVVQSIPCGGKFPCDLLFAASDKLAVANVRSGNITFFRYKEGQLTALNESVSLPGVSCLEKGEK